MKKILAILTVLVALNPIFAQTASREINVVNFVADWCPVCKAHADRYAKEIVTALSADTKVHFFERNMTNAETMSRSDMMLQPTGVLPALSGAMYTGVLYLVDAQTNRLVSEVSVSQPTDVILEQIESAKMGKTSMPASDDPKVYYLAIQYLNPGGTDKLNAFNQKAMPILGKYGFKAEGAMKPFHILPGIGGNPMEVPDQIVVFSAPDNNALLRLVSDPEYQAILPLRAEALRELTFIATKKLF